VDECVANPKQYSYDKLRGKIKEVCGTQGNFANELGRTEAYLSSLLNNKSFWEQRDIDKSILILHLKITDIGSYFFTPKVHKNETSGDNKKTG